MGRREADGIAKDGTSSLLLALALSMTMLGEGAREGVPLERVGEGEREGGGVVYLGYVSSGRSGSGVSLGLAS